MDYRACKLKTDIRSLQQKIAVMTGERDILLAQRREAEAQRQKAQAELGINDQVQILLQKTSEFARQQAKRRIEEIVTSALSVVFDRPYQFRISLEVRGNRPEVDYWLQSGEILTQLKPPDYDKGGGVIDVITLALRLAIGELTNLSGPIFLDEVGKHVSAEYAPHVAFFLKEYSEKFNRQIILITHNEALAEIGDVSLSVGIKDGRSEVKAV